MPTQIAGLEVATSSKTKSRGGLSGLRGQFATRINGQLLTCKKYKKGPSGQIRCEAMDPGERAGGRGSPRPSARKGIKSPFNYKRAGTKKPGTKAKGKKVAKVTVDARRARRLSGENKGTLRKGCTTIGAPKGKAKCDKSVKLPTLAAAKKAIGPAKKTTKRKATKRKATKRYSPADARGRAPKRKATKKKATKKKATKKKRVYGGLIASGGPARRPTAAGKKSGTKAKGTKAAKSKAVAAARKKCNAKKVKGVPLSLVVKKDGKVKKGCNKKAKTCSVKALKTTREGRIWVRNKLGPAGRCA
jgi:hypothetical protein